MIVIGNKTWVLILGSSVSIVSYVDMMLSIDQKRRSMKRFGSKYDMNFQQFTMHRL